MTPTKPTTVAALRGLLYAIAGAIVAVIIAKTSADASDLGIYGPPLLLVGRYLEALLLDKRQPLQAGPLGGATAPGNGRA